MTAKTVDVKTYIHNNVCINEDGCWEWQRFRCPKGYGGAMVQGKRVRVHRLSYAEFVGPIPDGMYVLHKCNNPSCCNPEHLYVGTQQDNMDDMKRALKGTWKVHPADRTQLLHWHEQGYTMKDIAKWMEVSPSTVSLIIKQLRENQ